MPTTVVVEYSHAEPLTDDQLAAMAEKLRRCFEIAEVRWVECLVSIDRKTQLGVFEATDAHTVQTAHRMLGIEFVRSWPMQRVFTTER